MPSYIMHLSIAKEYIRKHPGEIHNEEEFFYGTLAPDFTKDKLTTHYSFDHIGHTDFFKYLRKEYNKTDFDKGYMLHLLADELFYIVEYGKEYKELITNLHRNLYNDYDIISKDLINKYDLTYIPEEVKPFAKKHEGDTEFLKLDRVYMFIDKTSKYSIEDQIKHIKIRRRPLYDLDKDNINYSSFYNIRTIFDLFNKK